MERARLWVVEAGIWGDLVFLNWMCWETLLGNFNLKPFSTQMGWEDVFLNFAEMSRKVARVSDLDLRPR